MKLLYSLFLLAFLVFCVTPVKADTFYRETFNYCESPTGRPSANRVAAWRASTTGNKEGKPSQLRIQSVGAKSRLPGVKSNVEGPIPGNIFWNRNDPTKGLLIYTKEYNFDIAEIFKVTWQQRIDRQDKTLSNYGARLAFLIGGQWYISDTALTQSKKNAFEKREFVARSTTYGISLPVSGTGIAAPTSSGIALPAHGTVSGFGLFFNNAFARVRIDDFALVNTLPLGSTPPDVGYPRCRRVKVDPNTAPDDSNPTGGDVQPPPPKAQCENGFDDDGDGLLDMNDPGCKSPGDNFEAGGVPPEAPIDLQASDGTSSDFVRVTWAPSANATSYKLHRSEVSPSGGDVIAEGITTPDYKDRSAVPGVTYYYWVTAINSTEDESTQSNADQGYRSSPVIDTDGDGVTDEQENNDGTDPKDPGSFQLHLKSPAFTKYNTFLGQWNFLELGASGSKAVNAKVEVLSLGGTVINTQAIAIAPKTQIDLDINTLLANGCIATPAACQGLTDIDKNGLPDTYGLARIEFNDNASDPGAALLGRMSNYRPNADGQTFSFAFAKELRNPTFGITFAGANTFDPQGQGFLVPNWLELSNLDAVPRDFDYILWTQGGAVAKKYSVRVPAFGERDVQAGHEILSHANKVKEGVYLAEVRPKDGATSYFATVSRYSSNSVGAASDSYNFAFALDALSGTGSQQLALISNLVGQCSTQTNWFEVINVRDVPVVASVRFRARNGTSIGSSDITLSPKSQYHFNASALLEKNTQGSVSLTGSVPGSLLGQSLVYFHDCQNNTIQTAYAVQAHIPGQDVQQGSVNTYLGMKNEMYFISAISGTSNVLATLYTFDPAQAVQNLTLSLDGQALNSQLIAEAGAFSIPSNRYGALVLKGQSSQSYTAGVLRIRNGANGVVDFVMPTNIQ